MAALPKDEQEAYIAEDAGGPEKQFFAEAWQMVANLEVRIGGKSIRLFELSENKYPTYIPRSDDCFKDKDGKFKEDYKHTAERYYRAIGRLFVHSLFRGHPIPTQVLPRLFRNGSCNIIGERALVARDTHCFLFSYIDDV